MMIVPSRLALEAEHTRRACRTLHGFTKIFWDVIEPATVFRDNWHLRVIAEHLEACAKRNIRRLLINIPPRCQKSISVGVMFLPWVWGAFGAPHERFVFSSYAANLSLRDSRHSRRIIASSKYQAAFGHTYTITGQDSAVKFENDRAGFRLATSVGGLLTGEGANFLISDDPHSALEAQSDVLRQNAIDWYQLTFSTRLNDPAKDVEISVMQRLHEKDLSGFVLAEIGGFEHLCIPMEWDGVPRRTFLGPYDPRTSKGELLWPERFPPAEVEQLKRKLGTYGSSGQLQQSPAPAEGGILNPATIQLWPSNKPLPAFTFVLQSYDSAFTEKSQNDFTAMLAFGIFEYKDRNCVMLLDAWQDHLGYPDLRKRAKEEWASSYGETRGGQRRADAVLIEDKGSGISLRQDLQRAGIPVRPYNPGKADKIVRAHLVAPLLEAGLLYVPESGKRAGQPVSWSDWLLNQLSLFPNGEFDDGIDALTMALIYLHDSGLLSINVLPEEDEEDEESSPRSRSNPYTSSVRR